MTPAESQGPAAKPRVALPLSAKILAWFFVNLLFLGIVAAFVVQGQFRFGLDSLLTGRAGDRLQALSEVIVAELNARGRNEWPTVIKRFADAYQMKMAVVRNDGSNFAGEIPEVPAEVRARLGQPLPRVPGRSGGPQPEGPREGPRDGPREGPRDGYPGGAPNVPPGLRNVPPDARPPEGLPRGGRPPDGRPADGSPRDANPPPPAAGGVPGAFPKFILKVDGPYPYWIGIRAPIIERNGGPYRPLSLVMAVPSLGSGGLLLDYTPWLWIGAGLLVCSVLFWFPLVRGITRSIKQMTGAAGEMARGRFEARVETGRRDELGLLGESLNHMSGRLEEYVTGQKRFLGDIAHELCSPLARMEMAIGVLEQQSGEKQQPYVNDVREEVRHMSSLVNELLSFTKAGLRSKEIELRPVSLGELCGRVVAREAQEKAGVTLDIDADLRVLAEADLLARAVANVLRNALRYAGDSGPIVVSASARGAEVFLLITDRGPGVPEESLHRLFDPFYRPETARTREGGGVGLGLAIVKSCVEACGGSVAVKNTQPSGLEVTMILRRAV